jgi:CHAT domain-containing protein/Tfp pilus assembly protein PilF
LGIYETQYYKNTTEIGVIYNNIGLVYYKMGEYLKSLNYFNKSVKILENNSNTSPEILANVYNNLGDVYRKLRRNELAKNYFDRVYDIYSLLYNESSLEVSFIYNNYANFYKDIGEYDHALIYYEKSLKIRKEIFDSNHDKIAQIYQNIGLVYYNQGLYDSALIYLQKSICANSYSFNDMSIHKNPIKPLDAMSSLELLETLTYKAELLLKLSQLNPAGQDSLITMALDAHDLAIEISDHIRDEFQNEKSRILLNSKTHQIYSFSIEYLIDQKYNYLERLFEYFERSKNYELFTAIIKQKAKIISGISKGVLKKEKEYRSLINHYGTRAYGGGDSVYRHEIEKRLFDITKEYATFIADIEKAFPKYHSLKFQYNIPKASEIQLEIDCHQAVVSYYYEDTSLYICVISKDTIILNQYFPKYSLKQIIPRFLKSLNLIQIHDFYVYSKILYQILIAPIKSIIKNKSELLIIPYGQLYYIPFEALIYEQKNNADSTKNIYLINDHVIKYHYSATLWYQEIKNNKTSLNPNNYLYEFTGFAPMFLDEPNKNEFYNSLIKNQYCPTRLTIDNISPLPYSGEEVNSIYVLFKSMGINANQYLQGDASEYNFKSNVSNSKYIHIATHGFLNKKEPSFSGLIFYDYLFKSVNNNPDCYNTMVEDNDGILYLNELYHLDITAELAVISACEGGNGKLENSEGIISLARGLIYAGVDNIIISLFKISDKHTKDLMVCFYKKIISGCTFAEALRMAKLQLIESKNGFPKLWAGFILIGK